MNDENNKSGCDRRGLIKGLGAAAAGLAFLPFVRGRIARATPGPTARARRLLIINLSGGVRSSAAFHASPSQDHNPYGLISTATPFALGRILDDTPPGMPPLPDADYQLPGTWAGAQLPRLREIANQFSVLGTYSTERGDHLRARIEEPTGSSSQADPGILTRIAAGLDAAGMTPTAPPFHVQPGALFGNGLGALTKFVPVSLQGYYSLPSAGNLDQQAVQLTGRGYAVDDLMRDQFDQARINTRHGQTRLVTSTFSLHRVGARVIGARLSQPDMAVGNTSAMSRAQTFGTVNLAGNPNTPLENGMLFDLFKQCLGTTGGQYETQATNAALAIRLLQLGSPAVTLEIGNFDFHSGERQQGPALYSFLGRFWAALHWLLNRLPDPSGEGTMFDRTTVVTMSDFGRDKATGGWNGGEGTDHGADYACFYLAHAMMGGGVVPNKLVGPVDTNSYNATSEPIRYSCRELLVTLLDSMGFDPHDDQFGLPAGGNPIGELFT